jgi:membrane-associated phospholipid phosphatase
MSGLIFKDDYIRVTGRMVFESVLYSGIVTSFLKSFAGRYRPYTNEGSNYFQPLQFSTEKTSFPSGHTTVAFAISSVLANRIKNTYDSIGLYTLAGITGLSRI